MRRLWSTVSCALATFLLVLGAPVEASKANDLRQLTSTDFKTKVASGLWLVEFFSPLCPHCRHFEPTWRNLTEKYAAAESPNGFHMAQVNCIAQGDVCEANKIRHYPEMRLFANGADLEAYSGDRTEIAVGKYINEKIEEHARNSTKTSIAQEEEEDDDDTQPAGASVPNPEGTLLSLTKKTFTSQLEQGPLFVKFFAPWCGHCKKLAPVWLELASRLKGAVNVAEVNCDDNAALCSAMNVKGYPTLMLFNAGSKVDYQGTRELDTMERFARKATSTGLQKVRQAEFLQMAEQEKVLFLYLYSPGSSKDIRTKVDLAARALLGNPPVIRSKDPELWVHLDQSAGSDPVLVAIKHGEALGIQRLTAATTQEALIAWMMENRMPLSDQLTSENFETVMRSENGPFVVLVALDPVVIVAEHEANTARLHQIARDWHASGKKVKGRPVAFVWMDGKKWGPWLKSMYGIKQTELPSVVIADHPQLRYYDHDHARNSLLFSAPSIHGALVGINKGIIYSKSSENVVERTMRSVHRKITLFMAFLRERPFQSMGIAAVILSLIVIGLRRLLRMDAAQSKHDRLD